MEGEPAMQHLINIHFFSKGLARLASRRPAMLYFVFNADVVTVVVAHSISDGEFVAQASVCGLRGEHLWSGDLTVAHHRAPRTPRCRRSMSVSAIP